MFIFFNLWFIALLCGSPLDPFFLFVVPLDFISYYPACTSMCCFSMFVSLIFLPFFSRFSQQEVNLNHIVCHSERISDPSFFSPSFRNYLNCVIPFFKFFQFSCHLLYRSSVFSSHPNIFYLPCLYYSHLRLFQRSNVSLHSPENTKLVSIIFLPLLFF